MESKTQISLKRYKLVNVDDSFSKSFKSYLGENAVHNFINSMVEESKYCGNKIKKHFNKELVMTKNDKKDFESSINCWICGNVYVDGYVKVRDHCQVTGKCRDSAHRD